MNKTAAFTVVLLVLLAGSPLALGQGPEGGRRADPAIWVRAGFSLNVARADVRGPWFMAIGNDDPVRPRRNSRDKRRG